MAIYDFVCQNNTRAQEHALFEVRLPIADRDLACVRCPICGSEARRLVVPLKAPACVVMKKQETSDKQIPERLLP